MKYEDVAFEDGTVLSGLSVSTCEILIEYMKKNEADAYKEFVKTCRSFETKFQGEPEIEKVLKSHFLINEDGSINDLLRNFIVKDVEEVLNQRQNIKISQEYINESLESIREEYPIIFYEIVESCKNASYSLDKGQYNRVKGLLEIYGLCNDFGKLYPEVMTYILDYVKGENLEMIIDRNQIPPVKSESKRKFFVGGPERDEYGKIL